MFNIYCTSWVKNSYLLNDFKYLADKFLGLPIIYDIAPENEKSSTQLKRLVGSVRDEYIILLKEDFYFHGKTDLQLLEKLCRYAIENKVDRLGLQSVKDGYEKNTKYHAEIAGEKIYKLSYTEPYLCSLEASIWRRNFLDQHLVLDGSDRDIEVNMFRHLRGAIRGDMLRSINVLIPENKIFTYSDALINGETRIKLIDGWFHKLIQAPDGGDLWQNLQIKKE